MASLAILFGALLSILGGILYAQSEPRAPTALIPSYVGVALIVLGIIARNEKARMHAMHAAALLGLLGFLAGMIRGVMGLMRDPPAPVLAWTGSLAMGALCGVFLVLCVKSFIDARRARKAQSVPPASPPLGNGGMGPS